MLVLFLYLMCFQLFLLQRYFSLFSYSVHHMPTKPWSLDENSITKWECSSLSVACLCNIYIYLVKNVYAFLLFVLHG